MNIIEKLIKESYTVYILSPVDKYLSFLDNYPELHHIPLKRLKRKNTNPVKELLFLFELIQKYRQIRPDLVLHYTIKPNIFGGIAAGLLRMRSIAVVTGLGYAFIHKGFLKELTKRLYRFSFNFHKKIILENEDDLQLFKELKIISGEQGISIKGCGVDTTYFSPVEKKQSEPFIFTFIGRLIYDKGIREFVEAARIISSRHKGIVFWIVGKIDKENPAVVREKDLEEWTSDKSIIYHGPKENIRKYIGESDCVVLPSYREGLPKVLLESMSMAKPVISTDSPGCREAVDHEINGFTVPVKSIMPLAEAMEKMLQLDKQDRKKMGLQGRKKTKELFADHIIADKIFMIISNVLDN